MAPSSGGKQETDEGGSGRGAGGSGRGSGGGNLTPEAAEKQLQARWERIEEALGELPEDDEAEEKLMALKGQWFNDAFAFLSALPPSAHLWCRHRALTQPLLEPLFTDAFSFLSALPPSAHLWCRHRSLTQPLLEPFYHYHSGPPDTRATLHALWARMAGEMRACTRCVARYHAAKRVYEEEYVEEVVGPVLDTLRRLDEERVAGELRALVGRAGGTGGGVGAGSGGVSSGSGGVSSGSGGVGSGAGSSGMAGGQVLDAERDGPGVICLMFELLMYPRVLEDAEVFALAGPALVLVERHFDLSLTPGQRYPVSQCRREKGRPGRGERDGPGVICVMFELLMYPRVLEDAEVFSLAGPALVLVERHFDLSLTPGQRYRGLYHVMLHPIPTKTLEPSSIPHGQDFSKVTRAIVYTIVYHPPFPLPPTQGLYHLMLHPNKDTRAIVYTLAKPLGLFKTAADLRPIDPLLQQCMHVLEYDLFDTSTPATGTGTGSGTGSAAISRTGLGRAGAAGNATASASAQGGAGVGGGREGGERPRVVHSKEDMWQGLLTILSLMAAPALDEGVMERYPAFVSIVLPCAHCLPHPPHLSTSLNRSQPLPTPIPLSLSLMAPPALDEGVVERYPAFVSIVLNHVGEDTSVFRPALACLRMMLQVTGYKLWLHSAFPPGVVRNTLISQCFNSSHEPTHKLLLDLLPPFLQSVESLETEEFERQRRNILFFLLIQLPNSRNFSTTTIKIARRIAFSLILHSYLLTPPLPPTDCADIWGPPLVGAVKDASLPDPLRLPAIHLAQAIITADTAALTSLALSRAFAGTSVLGPGSGPGAGSGLGSGFAVAGALFSQSLVCPGEGDEGGHGGEGGGGGGSGISGAADTSTGQISSSSTSSLTTSSSSSSLSSISEGLPQDQLDRLAEVAAAESDRWQCAPALWLELLERNPPQWLPKPLLRAAVWVAGHFCLSASAAAAAAGTGGGGVGVTSAGSKPLVTSGPAVTSSAVVTAALHWRLAPGAGGGGRGAKAGCVNAVAAAEHEEELSVILQR
ncbi:unnamed protein product [Closterium sp. NIES-65]|nr:unnamed protein product [Closterium sp. NIES-65]